MKKNPETNLNPHIVCKFRTLINISEKEKILEKNSCEERNKKELGTIPNVKMKIFVNSEVPY